MAQKMCLKKDPARVLGQDEKRLASQSEGEQVCPVFKKQFRGNDNTVFFRKLTYLVQTEFSARVSAVYVSLGSKGKL